MLIGELKREVPQVVNLFLLHILSISGKHVDEKKLKRIRAHTEILLRYSRFTEIFLWYFNFPSKLLHSNFDLKLYIKLTNRLTCERKVSEYFDIVSYFIDWVWKNTYILKRFFLDDSISKYSEPSLSQVSLFVNFM